MSVNIGKARLTKYFGGAKREYLGGALCGRGGMSLMYESEALAKSMWRFLAARSYMLYVNCNQVRGMRQGSARIAPIRVVAEAVIALVAA